MPFLLFSKPFLLFSLDFNPMFIFLRILSSHVNNILDRIKSISKKSFYFFSKRMSEESEDVTPEQTDKIVSYSAATGNDDLDVCQSNLRVT